MKLILSKDIPILAKLLQTLPLFNQKTENNNSVKMFLDMLILIILGNVQKIETYRH